MFNLNESAGHQGPTATATRRLSLNSAGNVVEGTSPDRERLYCAKGDLIPVTIAEAFRMLPGQEAEATDESAEASSTSDEAGDETGGQRMRKLLYRVNSLLCVAFALVAPFDCAARLIAGHPVPFWQTVALAGCSLATYWLVSSERRNKHLCRAMKASAPTSPAVETPEQERRAAACLALSRAAANARPRRRAVRRQVHRPTGRPRRNSTLNYSRHGCE
jgi:hypothetical protein